MNFLRAYEKLEGVGVAKLQLVEGDQVAIMLLLKLDVMDRWYAINLNIRKPELLLDLSQCGRKSLWIDSPSHDVGLTSRIVSRQEVYNMLNMIRLSSEQTTTLAIVILFQMKSVVSRSCLFACTSLTVFDARKQTLVFDQ